MGGTVRFLGETGRKLGLNVEKCPFFQGLSRELFQFVPDTSGKITLHTFFDQIASPPQISKTPRKLKNWILDKFQTVPSFLAKL